MNRSGNDWQRESRHGRTGLIMVAATIACFAALFAVSLTLRAGGPIEYPVSFGLILIPIGMIAAIAGLFEPAATQRAGLAALMLGGGVFLLMVVTGYPRYSTFYILTYLLVISGLVLGLRTSRRI